MRPETIELITEMLKKRAENAKSALMTTIECEMGEIALKVRIEEYLVAYKAYSDFADWVAETEEE